MEVPLVGEKAQRVRALLHYRMVKGTRGYAPSTKNMCCSNYPKLKDCFCRLQLDFFFFLLLIFIGNGNIVKFFENYFRKVDVCTFPW